MSNTHSCEKCNCIYRGRCSKSSSQCQGKTLAECKVGEKTIIQFLCPLGGPLCHKLSSLGLIGGAEIVVLGSAPFGDPMMIEVGQVRLALRKSEASIVETESSGT